MKHKLISLALAAAMAVSTVGCAMTTPASVGVIGGQDVPAGLYLLTQYNAFSAAAAGAELAEGESASDVGTVLRAQVTGDIAGEEVTATGSDFIRQLTLADLRYYVAVEQTFEELGGTLDAATQEQVRNTVSSLWESNSALYEANGIGQTTMQNYLANLYKENMLLSLFYGDDGVTPLSEKAYTDFVTDECYYIQSVQVPLLDYSTLSFASDEQTEQLRKLAQAYADALNEADVTTAADILGVSVILSEDTQEFLTSAFELLEWSFDPDTYESYVGASLFLPDDVTYYKDATGENNLTDPLDAAKGNWTVCDLGSTLVVARRGNALAAHSIDELKANYDLLSALASEPLQAELRTRAAALEQNMVQSAMDTYKAANIKLTV